MNVLDLFSGIGGFSLGFERAGMETVAFCEQDEFCQRVLKKHWPDVPIHNDIRKLDGSQYRGTVELVSGGFPCQPFSVAGKQGGDRDDRHLWPEMRRVIWEVQPTWVIGENVIGLEGLALDQCVSDLESDGFAVQVFDIPACGVGAIHRRHRLWIVAHAGCVNSVWGWDGSPKNNGTENEGGDKTFGGEDRFVSEVGRADMESNAANTNSAFSEGNRDAIGSKPKRAEHGATPPVCRADDGISHRVDRLKALGNAVVPQVVEQIAMAIMRCEVECLESS